jgi:hypothetical protein
LLQKDIVKNIDKNTKDNSYFGMQYYISLFDKTLRPDKTNLFYETIKKLLLEMDLDFNSDDLQKELTKVLRDSNRLDKETLNTINKEIDDLIKKTKAQGKELTRQELVEQMQIAVNNKFNVVYKQSRVKTIGRTVTTFTSEAGKREVANKYKFKLVWISERDGQVRPNHRLADGQKQNDKGKFRIGIYETSHPAGEGLPANESINCRCVTRPVRN